MSIKLEIPSLNKFRRGLKDLPERVARKILKTSLKKSGEILLNDAQSKVPVASGKLKESLRLRVKTDSPVQSTVFIESAYSKNDKKGAWYASLIEHGSKYVIKRGKKIIKVGFKAKQPFMLPAFEEKQDEVRRLIAKEVGDAVAKEWKKLGDANV